jgi:hypothetical protein
MNYEQNYDFPCKIEEDLHFDASTFVGFAKEQFSFEIERKIIIIYIHLQMKCDFLLHIIKQTIILRSNSKYFYECTNLLV